MSNAAVTDSSTTVARSRFAHAAPLLTLLACGALAGCNATDRTASNIDPVYGVSASPRVIADGEPVPRGGGSYKVGKPYVVAGKTYYPAEDDKYVAVGTASWYGKDFHGRKTANGEVFDMGSISAAHKTLPMPSYVRVTNLSNNRSIIARVNNRGPYVSGRLIDVSYHTAELLGFAKFGVAKVKVEYVGRAPLDGSDDRKLAMTLRQDGSPAVAPESSGVMVASAKPFVPQVAAVTPASTGEVPLPQSRPYDLGEAADDGEVPAPAAPPVRQARAPEAAEAPATVASAARPALPPAPRTPPNVSLAAAGWSSGAAPVSGLGFAGVPAEGVR